MKVIDFPYEIKPRQHDELIREMAAHPWNDTGSHVLEMHNIHWPNQCVCCQSQAPSSSHTLECEAPWKIEENRCFFFKLHWQAPYCSRCLRHADIARKSRFVTYGMGLLLWLALALPLNGLVETVSEYLIIFAMLSAAAVFGFLSHKLSGVVMKRLAGPRMSPSCAHYGYAVTVRTVVHPRVIRFAFYNDDYGYTFAALNVD